MYLMYVDESGDPGNKEGSSPHYILTGIIIRYSDWSTYLDRLKKFRVYLQNKYGLPIYTEIHASELVRIKKIKAYRKITKSNRVNILKECSMYLPRIFSNCRIINVCFDKTKMPAIANFQELAWDRLIMRYNAYLKYSVKDEGSIYADESSEILIRNKLRKMRIHNLVKSKYNGGSYNAPVKRIIEDVFHRDSKLSYFIQMVDVAAFLLYSNEYPKGATKKYNLDLLFYNLEEKLLLAASPNDKYGIVRK